MTKQNYKPLKFIEKDPEEMITASRNFYLVMKMAVMIPYLPGFMLIQHFQFRFSDIMKILKQLTASLQVTVIGVQLVIALPGNLEILMELQLILPLQELIPGLQI